jgi:hypothetical protein
VTKVTTATVETLAAEVRVLMVGSRQVTLSVYNQLDYIPHRQIEPFGRVNPRGADTGRIYVVGRDRQTGVLARAMTPRWGEELDRAPHKRAAEQLAITAVHRFAAIEAPRITTDETEWKQYQHAEACAAEVLHPLAAADLVPWLSVSGVVYDGRAAQAGLTFTEIRRVERLPKRRTEPEPGSHGEQALQVVERYQQAITKAQAYAATVEAEWSALPLIVLAGLR